MFHCVLHLTLSVWCFYMENSWGDWTRTVKLQTVKPRHGAERFSNSWRKLQSDHDCRVMIIVTHRHLIQKPGFLTVVSKQNFKKTWGQNTQFNPTSTNLSDFSVSLQTYLKSCLLTAFPSGHLWYYNQKKIPCSSVNQHFKSRIC